MKYTIHVNQIGAQNAGLMGKVDIVDLAIFDAFKDFANTNRCEKLLFDGRQWFWISYTLIIDELPFLGTTASTGEFKPLTPDSIYRRMKKLSAAGVIEFCPQNQALGKSYFSWGPAYDALITTTPDTSGNKSGGSTDEIPEGSGDKSEVSPEINPDNQLTKNDLTNPGTNNQGEPEKEKKADRIKREALEALRYLVLKTERKFQETETNLKFSSGRLKDGATLDDLKMIVDQKTDKWKGTDQAQYLRPSTLFQAEKFDAYLNAAKEWKGKQDQTGGNGVITTARESGIYKAV